MIKHICSKCGKEFGSEYSELKGGFMFRQPDDTWMPVCMNCVKIARICLSTTENIDNEDANMYTKKEIEIANTTARSKGSSVYDKNGNIRSVVAKYVEGNVDKSKRILDYGCGPNFIQGSYLNSIGFNVDGYDFGENKPNNCVVDIVNNYDVVYASNVLNVQSSRRMIIKTLKQIYGALNNGGEFICNYPSSPRKSEVTPSELKRIIVDVFGSKVVLVGGGASNPILKTWKFIS